MSVALPDIDIIIPFHQLNKDLISAIRSVEKCEGVDARLILVNDTNGASIQEICTPAIDWLEVFTDSRGYVSAMHTGIMASTRAYVGFLDSDDLTKSDRYRIQIERLRESNCQITTGELVPISITGSILKLRPILGGVPTTSYAKEKLILGSHGADSTIVAEGNFIREHWKSHKNFPAEFADYAWIISLPEETSITHCDKAIYFYRRHPNQMSRKKNLGTKWGLIFPHLIENHKRNFSSLKLLNLEKSDESVMAAIIFPSTLPNLTRTEKHRMNEICHQIIESLRLRNEAPEEIRKWKKTLSRRTLIATRSGHPKYIPTIFGLFFDVTWNRLIGVRARVNA